MKSELNQKAQTGLVIFSGAGLQASIWGDVLKELDSPSLVIDYPADNSGRINYTFDDYLNHASEQIENSYLENFVIVAHSIGAIVGLKMAEEFAPRIKGFVAIGSMIPASGNSFASSLPFPQWLILPALLKLFGTKPPNQSIEVELCNDLSENQSLRIVEEFVPESRVLYTTKINYHLPVINRLYIKLTNDKAVNPDLQDNMAAHLNANKVISIESGHLPMLSHSKHVATIINDYMMDVAGKNQS